MRSIALLALAASVVIFSGCVEAPKKTESAAAPQKILEPSGRVKFSDIPVPEGFAFEGRDSYVFESSGIRVGVLRYHGRVMADRVVNFYREQMPMYNWVLLNVVEYGDRLMNFDREEESCIVTISPRGNRASLISICVGPKAAQGAKKAAKSSKS
jgi:hypothetical protein